MSTDRGSAGFSLVEALVALAVLALALTAGVAVLAGAPRAERRLAAQGEALAAIEATLEGLRGGTLPVVPGASVQPPPHPPGRAQGLRLALDVEPPAPGEPPGLYTVTVTAHYTVLGEPRRQRVETRVWAP